MIPMLPLKRANLFLFLNFGVLKQLVVSSFPPPPPTSFSCPSATRPDAAGSRDAPEASWGHARSVEGSEIWFLVGFRV